MSQFILSQEEQQENGEERRKGEKEVKERTLSGNPRLNPTAYASSKMESPKSLKLHPGSLARK